MLDHQDQIRLQGLIFRARLRDHRIDDNYGRLIKRAEALGLHPKPAPIPAAYDSEPVQAHPAAGGAMNWRRVLFLLFLGLIIGMIIFAG